MALTLAGLGAKPSLAQGTLGTGEARQIAEEAFIYGFPMVMNYTVFHEYFVDKGGKEYKAPPNQLYNTARVYTPKDTAIVTPNSDTPYSFVSMDLRAEPFVLCNPEIEKGRYFSIQLVDMYTFNYGYVGSRTTGNRAGCFMIAGPSWKGEKPDGIVKVFQINRYLINSPMLPDLKKNADGSLTIYIQKDSPGKDQESNWLPAPDGPPYVVMRIYWPKESALNGTWLPPAVQRSK